MLFFLKRCFAFSSQRIRSNVALETEKSFKMLNGMLSSSVHFCHCLIFMFNFEKIDHIFSSKNQNFFLVLIIYL